MKFSQVFEPFYSLDKGVHCVVFPVPFVPRNLWQKDECKSLQEAKMHLWTCVQDYQDGRLNWQLAGQNRRWAQVG